MKKREFLYIAGLLNKTLHVVPLLFGSLGLEQRLHTDLNANDIDVLIPEIFLNEKWDSIVTIMNNNGYVLYDLHEHAFEKSGLSFAFASIESLAPFAGIKLADIPILEEAGVCYYLLELQDYLKVYTASSHDGYRKNIKNKKDEQKIELINKALSKSSVGIVACSDAQKTEWKEQNQRLIEILEKTGKNVLVSDCIYEKNGILSGTGKERANELMKLFANCNVEEIYDISGGDMANEILDELDFEVIKKSNAAFWGYSDLTTVINAIYSQTGKSSVLFQIKNMVYGDYQDIQRRRFISRSDLFDPTFSFIQGDYIKGIVVGGNIRCFLKLAGTRYFPDMTNKVLLIESLGGKVPQMVTYLSQLRSCGVFDKISGILLGTFSEMESKGCNPDIVSLVQSFAGDKMPIARTKEIGHGSDSKAIWIGKEIELTID